VATIAAAWFILSLPAGELPRTVQAGQAASSGPAYKLPNLPDSLKFFVIGDFGNGQREQYELAEQMTRVHAVFPAVLVLTVGDNLYGAQHPQDFKRKFEEPYGALLQNGVKFYASLGNHDSRDQSRYALFNMGGRTYYSFDAPREDVKFIAIESDYPTPRQMAWVKEELADDEDWIIPYFHHPLYSSGRRHGSHNSLRGVLEPMFLTSNVSVFFAGHDHIYERTRPQHGITYFVVGSGGQLRRGNIDRRSGLTAAGFDADRAFLAAEIKDDELFFSAISRTGQVVDTGVIQRRRR
jgi:hypothetical protein